MKWGSLALSICMILPRSSIIWRSGTTLTPSIMCHRFLERSPAQRLVELSAFDHVTKPLQSCELLIGKQFIAELPRRKSLIQFLRSRFGIPTKLELRKRLTELAEVSLVGPLIGAWTSQNFQLATGDCFGDDVGQLDDLVIEMVRADIKRLVVNRLNRRL